MKNIAKITLLSTLILGGVTAPLLTTNFSIVKADETDPTNPVEPTQPEEKPTDPTSPEEKPTDPTDPTSPEEKPTDPTQPEEKPTDPTSPEEKPTDPTQPEEKPTDPTSPEEKPTDPAQPEEKPTDPAQPEERPTFPVAPENPITTDGGHTVIGVDNSNPIIQSADGTIKTVSAKEIGATVKQDGTLEIKGNDGKLKVLPKTGTKESVLFAIIGGLIAFGSVVLFRIKNNIEKASKK